METIQIISIVAAVVALIFAAFLASTVLKKDAGNEQIRFIGQAIQEGATAFLSREYRLLAIFVVVMTVILAVFIDFDILGKVGSGAGASVPGTAIAYLVGALGSGLAGFIGMSIAVRGQHADHRPSHAGVESRPARSFQQWRRHGRVRRRHCATRRDPDVHCLWGRQHRRRIRVWRLLNRALCQSRWWYLHESRRRRRRPRGQGRAGDTGRRSP